MKISVKRWIFVGMWWLGCDKGFEWDVMWGVWCCMVLFCVDLDCGVVGVVVCVLVVDVYVDF